MLTTQCTDRTQAVNICVGFFEKQLENNLLFLFEIQFRTNNKITSFKTTQRNAFKIKMLQMNQPIREQDRQFARSEINLPVGIVQDMQT